VKIPGVYRDIIAVLEIVYKLRFYAGGIFSTLPPFSPSPGEVSQERGRIRKRGWRPS